MHIYHALHSRLEARYGPPQRNDLHSTWQLRPGPLSLNVVLAPGKDGRGARIGVFDPRRSNGSESARFFDVNSLEAIEGVLAELILWLGDADPIGMVLAGVLDRAMQATGAEFGDVQIFDRQAGWLRLAGHRGLPARFVSRFEVVRPEYDTTVCARAFRQARPQFVGDVLEDAPFAPYLGIAAEVGFRAVQSIPLTANGGVAGVVSCLFQQPRATQPDGAQQIVEYIAEHEPTLRLCMS
jgi:hypothetical protein